MGTTIGDTPSTKISKISRLSTHVETEFASAPAAISNRTISLLPNCKATNSGVKLTPGPSLLRRATARRKREGGGESVRNTPSRTLIKCARLGTHVDTTFTSAPAAISNRAISMLPVCTAKHTGVKEKSLPLLWSGTGGQDKECEQRQFHAIAHIPQRRALRDSHETSNQVCPCCNHHLNDRNMPFANSRKPSRDGIRRAPVSDTANVKTISTKAKAHALTCSCPFHLPRLRLQPTVAG